MRDALNATGRPIFFNMCEWGVDDPATWANTVGNSWRTTGDIFDTWTAIMTNTRENDKWWKYAGPGGWNDPDLMEVGVSVLSQLTYNEQVAHFSLWALMKSPLFMSNDILNMTVETLSIFSNFEVISVNQDPLGMQGHSLSISGTQEVWGGPLSDGSSAVLLFNSGTNTATITAQWTTIGFPSSTAATVRDLWRHRDMGTFTGQYAATVGPHGVVMIKVTPTKPTHNKLIDEYPIVRGAQLRAERAFN